MQEITKRRAIAIGWRARAPVVARVGALAVLVAAIVFVAVSYFRLRNTTRWTMKSESPALSKEVKGIVDGYEQKLMKNDKLYIWLRADRDITFMDDHHELEKVNLAVYPPTGDKPDQILSTRAIWDTKTSIITFVGDVKIETKDSLKVHTESIAYDQNSEIAQTEAPISFERENVTGHSTGAIVESKTKKLELKKDVEITVTPEAPKTPPAKPSTRSRPVTIKSAHALFEQESMKMSFSGGVTAEQERDIMSGENLYATLTDQKKLQKLEVRTNSYLRTMEEGRAAEVHSTDMDFFFDGDQRLEHAVAMKNAGGKTLDSDSDLQITGADLIEVNFQAQGDRSLLKQMRTEGRSVIDLSAPKSRLSDPRSASKRLTADAVKLVWRLSGRDLDRAEAVGNAELFVDPVIKNAAADTKTVKAPRIDCDFFETGNIAHAANATGGATAVIQPVQKVEDRGTRTLTSQKMTAFFAQNTQDVERMDAQGDAKFNENDRNGVANTIAYTAADNTVRLRGGEPTVWDSRARTKGTELDSDLTSKVSYSRGKTATTYYSQEQTNGATPFSKVKSPVYVVGDRGEFHSDTGIAIYTGNARAWQDDNFVRGDKLTIYVNDKRMDANGHVQSQIYNTRRRVEGTNTTIPVFASAESMSYSDLNRILHYEVNVDIRQGTDRITSGVADVYLFKESSDVEKTIAQRSVVLTQPNRKGVGDWVQYTTADEVAVLKGTPARVEDTEKGSTEGGRLTVYMRDGRVIADDVRGSQSGRVRSVHKVKKE
ncbi:MAG TPA: LPS export ABC transporter periplasmic protein LptC [Pyrinomonadaceae bacterium]|nr:LPS export ABC transporter periplasmic protein LptC [Pyrinomonadaceae bacterium]